METQNCALTLMDLTCNIKKKTDSDKGMVKLGITSKHIAHPKRLAFCWMFLLYSSCLARLLLRWPTFGSTFWSSLFFFLLQFVVVVGLTCVLVIVVVVVVVVVAILLLLLSPLKIPKQILTKWMIWVFCLLKTV